MKKLWFFFVCLFTATTDAHEYGIIEDSNARLWQVEIATSPSKREQGLMYRPWLAPWQGMLFIFPHPQQTTFWMKHTLIPLDIRFYDNSANLIVRYQAQPCTESSCPIYPSNEVAKYVLETSINSFIHANIQQIWLPIGVKVE